MKCHSSSVNNYKNKRISSLYINLLISTQSGLGLGTKILDFAQKYSKKTGCEGRFYVHADSKFNKNKVPHIFYRKYGLTTNNKTIDKKLDKFIKNNKNATQDDFASMNMFYTPKKESILTKIIKNLKH